MYKILYIILFFLTLSFAGEVDDVFQGKESASIRKMNEILMKNSKNDSDVLVLDLILETKGISTARKAQNYIKDYPLESTSTWMLLLLADYYSINNKVSLANSLLTKAKTRDETIVNDVYYKMVSSRLSGNLISSPGLKNSRRNNTLVIDLSVAKNAAREKGFLSSTDMALPAIPSIQQGGSEKRQFMSSGKYHLQVGAFSDTKNIDKTISLFKNKGYPVKISEKESNGKIVYLVWVGNYPNRNTALQNAKVIEERFGMKSFVVADPK